MTKSTWTAEQDATAKDMADRGFTASQIGEAIGKTRNAVTGRLWRLKTALTSPKPPPWTDDETATLRRLASKFYSAAEIGRTLGRTKNAVQHHASRYGIELKSQKKPPPPPRTPSSRPGTKRRTARRVTQPANSAPVTKKTTQEDTPSDGLYHKTFPKYDRECRWIDGDPQGEWSSCGRPCRPGSSYCEPHYQRSVNRVSIDTGNPPESAGDRAPPPVRVSEAAGAEA